MGIRGLTRLLLNVQKTHPYVKYRGKIIAIDVNILIYKFCHNYQNSIARFLECFIYKITSFLKFGIFPVFVFDGHAPKEKRAVIKKRLTSKQKYRHKLEQLKKTTTPSSSSFVQKLERKAFMVTKTHRVSLIRLLECLNLPYYIAEGEAEVLCALLQKAGQVDLTLSDDTDTIAYGCSRTIKMLRNCERYLIEIDIDQFLGSKLLTRDEFLNACVLTGCDYLNKRCLIDIEKCIECVKKHHTLENSLRELKKTNKMLHTYEEYQHIKDMYQFKTMCTKKVIKQQIEQGHYIAKRLNEFQTYTIEHVEKFKTYLQKNEVQPHTIQHLARYVKNSVNDFLLIRFNLFSSKTA